MTGVMFRVVLLYCQILYYTRNEDTVDASGSIAIVVNIANCRGL